MRYLFPSLIILAIVIFDELVSHYVLLYLSRDFYINSFLNIVHVWNTGISFGLFSGANSNIIFTILTIIIILIFTILMLKEEVKMKLMPYIMIIGGGIGNLLDRIRFGAVFDFIDFHLGSFHWPAFNVADAFICIGGIIFLLNTFLNNKVIVLE